jgi:bifunctional ADP-heptose synthase (sugar kinase/adenylyltransferase)
VSSDATRAPRLRNASFARNRVPDEHELPWLRIGGIDRFAWPRPLVLVNGGFDLLHSSHAKLIFVARDHAATLVCALDSDERVRAAKGNARPIQTFIERATMLGFMPIDALVEVASDADMRKLVGLLKPDLRVLGAEYRDKPTKFPNIPRLFVKSATHTSDIIERIKVKEKKVSL